LAKTLSEGKDKKDYFIREAVIDDLDIIQKIYAYHVENGLGSFEELPPQSEEVHKRIIQARNLSLPYLVAEKNSSVKGFAYVSPFRNRSAYRYTLEDSVYVAPESVGIGIGSTLLSNLIQKCAALGFRQMIAVIGDSENQASINLHLKHGFSHIGVMPSVGFKFGRWVDSVRMQRPLGQGDQTTPN
jgi:L-amino acid N-acyltransferase YncA|tara:strand:+ start:8033 stop:8590 length:558 start_codon:yes stop_codon:yes gene_type:complete